MTPFEAIDTARKFAELAPDRVLVACHESSGYEILVLAGHEPVVVPPAGPLTRFEAHLMSRLRHPSAEL